MILTVVDFTKPVEFSLMITVWSRQKTLYGETLHVEGRELINKLPTDKLIKFVCPRDLEYMLTRIRYLRSGKKIKITFLGKYEVDGKIRNNFAINNP